MEDFVKAAAGAFKPASKATRQDKGDATTRAAWEIIDRERNQSDAKTERLKALRLARDAAEPTVVAAPKKTKAKAAAKAPAKAPAKPRSKKAEKSEKSEKPDTA